MYKTSSAIRTAFTRFFLQNGHTHVARSSLVPAELDRSLLFTNAGMVQFKEIFLNENPSQSGLGSQYPVVELPQDPTGQQHLAAVTVQPCVRAGGKHNDLENVGRTRRHHTLFEMLGNFSFGKYFKEDAITFIDQLLVKEFQLPKNRLRVTVLEGDDTSYRIWSQLGYSAISYQPESENFWTMGHGDGPCGPCTEIFFDTGVEDGDERYLELWNAVFMQYKRVNGRLEPLAAPFVDTGMGLERITAVLQGKTHNFASDLFLPLLHHLHSAISPALPMHFDEWDPSPAATSMRVAVDHARAVCFLLADGVLPDRVFRGYALRRLIRRALTHLNSLSKDPSQPSVLFESLCEQVIVQYGDAYPVLVTQRAQILSIVQQECSSFDRLLRDSAPLVHQLIGTGNAHPHKLVSAEFAFTLHDTHGVPFDVIRDLCTQAGLVFPDAAVHELLKNQRVSSRQSWSKHEQDELQRVKFAVQEVEIPAADRSLLLQAVATDRMPSSQPTGTEPFDRCHYVGESRVFHAERSTVNPNYAYVLFPAQQPCPLYTRGGGQVGDTGFLQLRSSHSPPSSSLQVIDTVLLDQHPCAIVRVDEGDCDSIEQLKGELVTVQVETAARIGAAAHHSATHLLHAALKRVLGTHVVQAGSLVRPDALRFDFRHEGAPTAAQLTEVEHYVNEAIYSNTGVTTQLMDLQDAMKLGAEAHFGEKYPAQGVRVVQIGDFSMELCGGTHVAHSAEIGSFRILSSSGIGSGLRRILAVCGAAAHDVYEQDRQVVTQLAALLKCSAGEVLAKVQALKQQKKTTKQLVSLDSDTTSAASASASDAAAGAGAGAAAAMLSTPVKVQLHDFPAQVLILNEDMDLKEMKRQVKSLHVDDSSPLLLVSRGRVVVHSEHGNPPAQSLVHQLCTRLEEGKGGGSSHMAQGFFTNEDKLRSFLNQLLRPGSQTA